MRIECLVQVVGLRISFNSAAPPGQSPVHVFPNGMLVLAAQSQIDGQIKNEGVVRYEMPAPLGTFVAGGVVRSCSDEDPNICFHTDANFVERRGDPTYSIILDMLPQPCGERGPELELACLFLCIHIGGRAARVHFAFA